MNAEIKKQFQIFKNQPTLVYLDNAATTQTPHIVLDAMNEYYTSYRANVHRGIYDLSERASAAYEESRRSVANFINAESNEIVFTSGATHGLNLLAYQLSKKLTKNDNIVLTRLEHHANLIPWQQAAKRSGAELRFINLTKDGEIDLNSAYEQIDECTKIVSMTAVSNATGAIVPTEKIIAIAQEYEATTIIDAAQLIAHSPINVKELNCDYLVFSGHKMYGPTGVGVLYGRSEKLENLEPLFFGGDMIEDVSYSTASWTESPHKFEAGTQNIAGVIGLSAATKFITHVGLDAIHEHEKGLAQYLLASLPSKVAVVGRSKESVPDSIISFVLQGVHPHDVAEILNRRNIAVRAGHHCAKPLMKYLDFPGTLRVSFAPYNTTEDIDTLIAGIEDVKKMFTAS